MRFGTLILACFAFVACEQKPQQGAAPAGGPSGQAPGAADTILIGEVGSLTGAQATFGISTRNGIEMALDEVNARGGVKGKKVAVRVYDDQSKPEEAANAVTRLIAQDGAKLILGEVASTNSLAMAPKAQAAKVPMITPSSTNPKVTQVGDFIFRVCFIDPFQGLVMAKFAREHLKAQKAAVLRDNKSDYSLGLAQAFTESFKKFGGQIVVSEDYAQGDTDFRAQLTAIKSAAPDVVFVPGYYTDAGLIARQARQLGLKATLLGGDGWESEKLFELGGTAIEGSYYSNHYSPENPAPKTQKFLADYKQRFGAVPDSLAALGYDAAMVGLAAMQAAKDTSGTALRDAIARTKDFEGVAGKITLDENRNAIKPAAVLKVTGGKAQYMTTIAP
ncbi:MAG TPA: ABC transporter substrate-binding protein [Polyangiaceae bacterium]|nr:ABC transporter substrate-binding protein [Polyangiaceae bacterium]